jgi:hypothetical protein
MSVVEGNEEVKRELFRILNSVLIVVKLLPLLAQRP